MLILQINTWLKPREKNNFFNYSNNYAIENWHNGIFSKKKMAILIKKMAFSNKKMAFFNKKMAFFNKKMAFLIKKMAFLQKKKWHFSLNEKLQKTLNNKKIKR